VSSRSLLLFVALIAVTFASYGPAITAGFIWDDDDYVTNNPLLEGGDGLRRIWTTTETPQYYPLVFTSFWIENQLWGHAPMGYHLVNILLHALNAFLVGRILWILGVRGAWWIAFFFALHPVHVESVAWVTERKNVLSALFYLLAFLAYLDFDRSGRWRFYVLALLAFLAAMLSKTVAATFPFALLLALVWQKKNLERADLPHLAPFLAIAVALPLITVQMEGAMVETVHYDFGFSWFQRLAIASRALLFYPLKILVPYPLTFNYPRWDLDAGPLALGWPIAIVLALVVAMLVLWRRDRRGIVLAATFYAVTIAPALGFLDVYPFRYSFVADHFQYLASIGILILVVEGVAALVDRVAPKLDLRAARLAGGVGIAVLMVLSILTWNQAQAYHDLRTLWKHTIERNPESWLAHNNLGLLYYDSGEYDQALRHFDRAIASKPRAVESYTARGMVRAKLGDLESAEADFDRAVELDPAYALARLNRGNFYLDTGRYRQAVVDLALFVDDNPDYLPALRSLARARSAAGLHERALVDFDRIVELSPDFDAYSNRGLARINVGRMEDAVEDLTRAIALDPDSADAHANRAFALVRLERLEAARADFDRAIAIDPSRPVFYTLRGGVHDLLGDRSRACADWQSACRLGDCRMFEQQCRRGGT
jgi:tetratricopeptide (TPR) repeat protein